jgi:hypothetical protein
VDAPQEPLHAVLVRRHLLGSGERSAQRLETPGEAAGKIGSRAGQPTLFLARFWRRGHARAVAYHPTIERDFSDLRATGGVYGAKCRTAAGHP